MDEGTFTGNFHNRGLPTVGDPRDNPPNDSPPGDAVHTQDGQSYAPTSVGPDASEGFGNTHVMHPSWAQGGMPSAWSGWPVDWQTPTSEGGLLGKWGQMTDVVFAALDLNSSIIAAMPPYIVKGSEPQDDMPWLIDPEPEVYPSWYAFAKEAWWSLVATGEVFLYATSRYADSDGGRPRRFMVLNPAFVNVERNEGTIEYAIAGEPLDADDVLHIKYASWPGDLRGHGPLEVAGARLLAAHALTTYGSNMAASGGLPPAVLKNPRRLSRQQMAQMQEDWIRARMSNMGIPAVLADGTELDVLDSQLKDIALSELQKFSEARIVSLMGVPPQLLGLPTGDSNSYSNSTNIFDFHWRAYLRPRAEQVVKAMSSWLLPWQSAIELNRDEYIRPGLFERSQSYSMLIGAGVLSPDEVRKFERYSSRAGVAPEALSGATKPAQPPQAGQPYTNDDNNASTPIAYDALGKPLYGTGGRPTTTNTNPAN